MNLVAELFSTWLMSVNTGDTSSYHHVIFLSLYEDFTALWLTPTGLASVSGLHSFSKLDSLLLPQPSGSPTPLQSQSIHSFKY